MTSLFRLGTLVTFGALFAPGCEDSPPGGGDTGSETHWLAVCRDDAACGGTLKCICGTCTLPCSSTSDCRSASASATCASDEAKATLCADSTEPIDSVCLTACTSASACSIGSSCFSGSCIPNLAPRPDGGPSSGGGTSGGTGGAPTTGGTQGSGGRDASVDSAGSGGTTGSGGGGTDASSGGNGGGTGGTGGGAGGNGPSTGGTDAGTGDGTAVATYNAPCTTVGSGACLAHAQNRQLVCDGTKWVANGNCLSGTLCDTTPGSAAGECRPIVAECQGGTPGDVFCRGQDRLRCGADLVTTSFVDTCTNQVCAAGACTGVCAPPATQCSGNGVQTCDASGQWGTAVACVDQTCAAGACVGVCAPGTRCSSNNVETCNAAGQWANPVACASQACVGGACTGTCSPTSTQCSGNGVQTCGSTGTWGTVAPCTNQTCVSGSCIGVCAPGTTRCNGNGVQSCDASGQWGAAVACTNQTCVAGACTGICAPGDARCSGNGVQSCNGSGQWGVSVRCVSSACVAGVCTGVCEPGAKQCSGNGVQYCDSSGQWGTSTTCATPLVCAGGACTSPPSCTGVLVFDDFSGNSLDAATWSTSTNIPQGGASVAQTGGSVALTNRGYVNTVAQFVPSAGGVRVTGQWTFDTAWAYGDTIQVLTRSDGTPQPAPSTGETQAGLECELWPEVSMLRAYAWGATTSNETQGVLSASLGDTLIFEMTDDGSLVTCAIVNLTSGGRATASATSTFAPTTNRVTFHNREFEGATNRSLVDDVTIESGFVNRPNHAYMFEEASGSTTYDLPGTINGTLGAGASRAAAIRGAGVSFAGTSDGNVGFGTLGSSLGTADFTIGFWFKVPATTHRMDLFGNRVNVGDGNFIQLRITASGSLELELDEDVSGTNYHAITGGSGLDDGQWHHLAARRKGMTLSMFVDGALAANDTRATGTPTDLSNGAPLRLGSSAIAGTQNLLTTGAFDDLRIYNSSLGDCDIALIGSQP